VLLGESGLSLGQEFIVALLQNLHMIIPSPAL
jgi:hypothetical protein